MSKLIKSIMIEQDVDLCCSRNHKQPIQMVVFDPNLTKNERLLCQNCLEDFESNMKMVGLNKVLSSIDYKQIKQNEYKENLIQTNIEQVQNIQRSLIEIKQNILQTIDQLIGNSGEWIKILYEIGEQTQTYSFFEELDHLITNSYREEQNEVILKEIKQINLSWITKTTQKIQCLNQNYKQLIIDLKQKIQSVVQNNQKKEQIKQLVNDPINLKLVNNNQNQFDDCFAISFNNDGSMMVSGCSKDIKIWEFQNGKIREVLKLKGHTDVIRCLTFANQNNSIISGSGDCSIRCWKQLNFKQWKSSQAYTDHTDQIECILLSKDDTQLISCSQDKSIKIWTFDIYNNELKFKQSLMESKCCLNSISLNFAETILISCGDDKQINMWQKNQSKDWEYKNIITQSQNEYGTKVCFLRNDLFIWVGGDIQNKNYIRVFELKDQTFIENTQKTIELENDEEIFDLNLFPIVYNQDQNIILIRHKFSIYLLREQNDGTYKIEQKIKQLSNSIQGSMTKDAKYLTFWDSNQKTYQIYQIETK
ncbi:unnamed protein product [Paramecium sonneborni]|uniref:WD40-repeat-containing domain n=1 Tax=Paramecium sonneborni TaxID=65129 RepID=A0A8S1LV67_9CILI|nr:unnamed protein product [Paramecium sonneborni]